MAAPQGAREAVSDSRFRRPCRGLTSVFLATTGLRPWLQPAAPPGLRNAKLQTVRDGILIPAARLIPRGGLLLKSLDFPASLLFRRAAELL